MICKSVQSPQQRPSILLTGFGHFPGIEVNATADLVPEVARRARERFADHEVIDAVLPVEWEAAPAALAHLLARGPSSFVLALHFGVSPTTRGFDIELVGRNVCGARYDATGALPSARCLLDCGPALLATTFPAERIIARLVRGGFPCATSDDAGDYLCNAVLYHSLVRAHAAATPFLSGFVHIPAGLAGCARAADRPPGESDATGLSWPAAVAGSMEIIAACLEPPLRVVAS